MTEPTETDPRPTLPASLSPEHHQCAGCSEVNMIYAPPGRPDHHDACTEGLRHCRCRTVWSAPA